jgi:hypothetical protein
MKSQCHYTWLGGAILAFAVLWAFPVSAQTTFSSGSTGALSAFAPPTGTTTVTLPADGVLNYTTINIPSGATVKFTPNAANTSVTMLATGDVTIAGTINVNGTNGVNSANSGPTFNLGGLGGSGGFAGGQSGSRGLTNNAASAGQGPGGGAPGTLTGPFASGGSYGASASFVSLIPLFGGSGGGGAVANSTLTGASGGGGGGAIVVASTTKITVTGSILANGGNAGVDPISSSCPFFASSGSGGAIRLVAPQITATGSLSAQLGGGGCGTGSTTGRIRLEAVAFGTVASTTPTASFSNTLGPITAASTPALINLPTLTISSVGAVASPATPGGSYTTADVSLPVGTTNPVPVTVTVTNTPLNTTFTVKLIPQFANPSTATCANTSGTFTISNCTANVTFPSGITSVLNAFASFTLTASLFPLIDGEPVDQVLVAATYGEPSTTTVITKSGKEVRVDTLSPEVQLAFAKGLEAMQLAQ